MYDRRRVALHGSSRRTSSENVHVHVAVSGCSHLSAHAARESLGQRTLGAHRGRMGIRPRARRARRGRRRRSRHLLAVWWAIVGAPSVRGRGLPPQHHVARAEGLRDVAHGRCRRRAPGPAGCRHRQLQPGGADAGRRRAGRRRAAAGGSPGMDETVRGGALPARGAQEGAAQRSVPRRRRTAAARTAGAECHPCPAFGHDEPRRPRRLFAQALVAAQAGSGARGGGNADARARSPSPRVRFAPTAPGAVPRACAGRASTRPADAAPRRCRPSIHWSSTRISRRSCSRRSTRP